MTPAATELARKLADHQGFWWTPGMRGTIPAMAFRIHREGDRLWAFSENNRQQWAVDSLNFTGAAVDLDDPATVGCVEAQVRALNPDLRFDVEECVNGITIWMRRKRAELVDGWEFHGQNITDDDTANRGKPRGVAWAAAFLEVVK